MAISDILLGIKIANYYSAYIVLSCVAQKNLKYLTPRQLSENKYSIEFCKWSIHGSRDP
jgi:hypothetical protein